MQNGLYVYSYICTISVTEVKAKINALRTRFSSEMLRIKEIPSNSGTEPEDIHKTYFEFF